MAKRARGIILAGVVLGGVFVVLSFFGTDAQDYMEEQKGAIVSWLFHAVPKILAIACLLIPGRYLLAHGIEQAFQHNFGKNHARVERLAALEGLVRALGDAALVGVAGITMLDIFSVDVGPLIASLGVVGIIVGFGTQSLVKDFLSGVFILLEDQYGIGDTVRVDTFEGTVIEIRLRCTVIKNGSGEVLYIRNGEIAKIINLSKK